ncbi:MAG: response regulator [Acetobacteraceae bacterium]|nr:response regulator [Acetobacteraceae bacterium]
MVFRSNLSARLIILVVAATLPALLVLVYLQHDLRNTRKDRVPDEALQQAELINVNMRSVMEGARQLAAAMARFIPVRRLDARCAGHMSEIQGDLPSYSVLSVRDAAGRLVCSSDPALASTTLDQHCIPPGAHVSPGEVQAGLFIPATDRRGAVLPLCVAFPATEGRIGYIVMELSLEWLARHIGELRLPPRSTVGIADRAGTTLVRVPGQETLAGRRMPDPVMPLIGLSQRGTAWAVGADGLERMIGYVPAGMPGQEVFVSIGLFVPDMLADIDDAAFYGSLLMALSIALSLGLGALAGERFVRRPAAALLDAARRWSDGDLGARARLREPPGSEFGTLAAAFNAMAETLGRRRSELEDLNATLEARVQERTRDLEASRNRLQIEIAERERTEAELHQAQKLQAVGQLAGGIAHDFNNLLTAIVGALDLIRRRLPPGQAALVPLIENALEAAQRGGRLSSQLLAFSRRQRLMPVPTDLNVPVLMLTGLLGSTLGRNIRIETDLAAELWPAMVDPTQVEAVILNLAINARDAMPEGGELTIRTRNVTITAAQMTYRNAVPGDYVALEVSDTGTGMAPAVMARAFEPFFTTKPQGQGAGLGLSQVHGLAVQSGGDAGIESRLGLGTRVTVLLPRAAAATARTGDEARGHRRAELPRLKVLVVDDDRAVREMAVEMLRERGHTVMSAADGCGALDILRSPDAFQLPFDVLLVDYVMPGMNGVALIQAARALHPGLHALLVTGNAESDTADSLRPEEMMRKPFTIAQLEARMAALMDDTRAGVAADAGA